MAQPRWLWLPSALLVSAAWTSMLARAEAGAEVAPEALEADDECLAGEGSSGCSLELLSLRARKGKADSQWGSCAQYGCTGYVRGHGCQCNSNCVHYGNCCYDYAAKCKPAPPPPPAPAVTPPAPSPSTPASGGTGDDGAAVPGAGPLLEFYVYRAQNDNDYDLENVNVANLEGVMWYLHHEIVNQCPRRFGITRILRLKMTMRATPELYKNDMNFGLRYAFDSGKCTSTHGFDATSDRYGFVVGCNNLGQKNQGAYPPFDTHYPGSIWYSIPGPCPSMKYGQKAAHCVQTQPGGKCAHPTGAWDCTWNLEHVGNITVDDLDGTNHTDFCSRGCVEYSTGSDRGRCTDFWDGYYNVAKNQARVKKAYDMFVEKYPEVNPDMPAPKCDFNSANYWGRAPPLKHKFGV